MSMSKMIMSKTEWEKRVGATIACLADAVRNGPARHRAGYRANLVYLASLMRSGRVL